MKKTTILLATILILVVCSLVFVACDNGDDDPVDDVLDRLTYSGTRYDLTWTLWKNTGDLKISGDGKMGDFAKNSTSAWRAYADTIKSTVLADGVTTIGKFAFQGCNIMKSIEIPNSVTTIGKSAFADCERLKDVYFVGTEEQWKAIQVGENNDELLDATIHFLCKTGTWGSLTWTYYQNTGELVISGTGGINDFESYSTDAWCAYKNTIRSIVIADGVISIGKHAFYDCAKLKNIEIPDGVTTIGDYAFYNCRSLESITFNENSQLTTLGQSAFESCESLTNIEIPSGVATIGKCAFLGCGSLKSVTFGIDSQLVAIGRLAFWGCRELSSVIFDENSQLTIIEYGAFSSCDSLTSIEIPASVTTIGEDVFSGCGVLTSVKFAENSQLTTIGRGAFNACSNLKSIEIPSSVTAIGDSAFGSCVGLTSIMVSEGNTTYHSTGNCLVETATKTLILGCKKSVIPADGSVAIIGDSAFKKCTGLEIIEIPNTVTTISDDAFSGCYNLRKVIFAENSKLLTVADFAFAYCDSLTSIEIPASVTNIGLLAFTDCYRLTSVTFEDPNGWYCTTTEGASSGTNLTLTDASTNATYLRSTYAVCYWHKNN